MSTIFTDIKVNNAEQFVDSISRSSANTKIYLTFGKADAWSNEAAPATANSSPGTVFELWSNMIGSKRILGGDVHHAIPRNNWTSNTAYFEYTHKEPNLIGQLFYVMNSEYSVYKCLSNNGGRVSTTEPTSINPETTSTTADGYVWKYMYTVSDSEKLRFTTNNYIPVKTLSADDGSQQWQVQDNAIDGAIDNIKITNPGTNYSNAATITVNITGDGSGATASASINSVSNTVSSITITESGMNYTYASVALTDSSGSGSGATAEAIIGPPGGHGANPLYELFGNNVIINPKIRYDEDGILPITNDFRQIALIKNMTEYGTTTPITDIAFLQALTIICDGSGDFEADEIVYQGASLAAATFSGRVISWNSATSKLLLINTKGTLVSSQSIFGDTSFTTRVVTSSVPGEAEPYSGRILYVDNLAAVTRSSDQIESFQILLKF